jgi:hypothetical protein
VSGSYCQKGSTASCRNDVTSYADVEHLLLDPNRGPNLSELTRSAGRRINPVGKGRRVSVKEEVVGLFLSVYQTAGGTSSSELTPSARIKSGTVEWREGMILSLVW